MFNEKMRDYIDNTVDKAVIFDDPAFDNSIIGTYENHIVYNYLMMVSELSIEEGCKWGEAVDFIERNVLSTIPYCGENYPIIIYPPIGVDDDPCEFCGDFSEDIEG